MSERTITDAIPVRGTGTLDRGTIVAGTGVVMTVVAFVAFLLKSDLTVVPLVAALVLFGYGWYAEQATTAKTLTLLATTSSVLVLVLIVVYLLLQAWPVYRTMGIDALTRTEQPMWSTSSDVYSMVPMMWGTLVTTLLAMAIAGPLGIAGAIYISEFAPRRVRDVVKPGVEILAGIPSIVYGFLGYVILNQYMMERLELPTFGSLFIVGLVVGTMALPTVVSIAEDAISSVPESMKDGSVALGTTDWQTVKTITVPAAFSGIFAAVLLGVGRAIGETMAATVILGHAQELPDPLYDVFGNTETLTSLIASQYGNAHGMHMRALFAAGVILFVTVLVLSVASQRIEARMKRKLGGNE